MDIESGIAQSSNPVITPGYSSEATLNCCYRCCLAVGVITALALSALKVIPKELVITGGALFAVAMCVYKGAPHWCPRRIIYITDRLQHVRNP